jgi:hypothetical protein
VSNKSNFGEELKEIAAKQKASAAAEPLPGTPGGKLVGYAEAMRHQNPEPGPSKQLEDAQIAETEFERAAGKPVEEMDEQDFYRTGVTFHAKDMTAMTNLHVVLKDKSMAPRWFNHKAAEGKSVREAYMRGFRAVTEEDVEFSHSNAVDENGAITVGDLVCLMMPKVRYYGGILKGNVEKAKVRVNRAMTHQGVRQNAIEGGQSDFGNASYYVPDIAQTQRADANEARRLVYDK